eukprot:5782726-Prymnesium_polylepis.2
MDPQHLRTAGTHRKASVNSFMGSGWGGGWGRGAAKREMPAGRCSRRPRHQGCTIGSDPSAPRAASARRWATAVRQTARHTR